jgi:hypothetical protein
MGWAEPGSCPPVPMLPAVLRMIAPIPSPQIAVTATTSPEPTTIRVTCGSLNPTDLSMPRDFVAYLISANEIGNRV